MANFSSLVQVGRPLAGALGASELAAYGDGGSPAGKVAGGGKTFGRFAREVPVRLFAGAGRRGFCSMAKMIFRTDEFRRWLCVLPILLGAAELQAAQDGFGNYTARRTVQDEIIGQIEYNRTQAKKDADRANRDRLMNDHSQRDAYYQAERERLDRQRAWAEQDAQERQARQLREAAERAVEEHWKKVSAGDPEALFTQANRDFSVGGYTGAVSNLTAVRGPRQVEAFKRAFDIMRAHVANYNVRLIDVECYLAEHGDPVAARFAGDDYVAIKDASLLPSIVRYYATSGRAGDRPSRLALIRYLTTEQVPTIPVPPAEYREWCQRYAEAGDFHAQAGLADGLYFGQWEKADRAAGLAWYAKAIAADPAKLDQPGRQLWCDGASRYAFNQYSGEVLPKDVSAAEKLWQRAAELGGAAAMYNLGMLEEKGESGAANLERAIAWWEKRQ